MYTGRSTFEPRYFLSYRFLLPDPESIFPRQIEGFCLIRGNFANTLYLCNKLKFRSINRRIQLR